MANEPEVIPAAGTLEVGANDHGEVVINFKGVEVDKDGVGHFVFTVSQAQHLALVLVKQAKEAEKIRQSSGV